MKNQRYSLRSLLAAHNALPRYVAQANTVSPARAARIARAFGVSLADCKVHLDQANTYAQSPLTYADTQGNGLGMFHNAESLFSGYLYDEAHELACDAKAYARYEESAFGGPNGQND